jgi:hypothetical protein
MLLESMTRPKNEGIARDAKVDTARADAANAIIQRSLRASDTRRAIVEWWVDSRLVDSWPINAYPLGAAAIQ